MQKRSHHERNLHQRSQQKEINALTSKFLNKSIFVKTFLLIQHLKVQNYENKNSHDIMIVFTFEFYRLGGHYCGAL